ncbi:ribose 1,5-bisphosphokinase [Moritella sp. 24]|uniref:ribose 1,5-bisphosphokinase n=1 Tax=Moritella sp. 24 TaxID=2746230 RepID=UPI001BAD7064|nr:ribose 1,5-bisphosphokinase [Moritella sp. 24]QUM75620.1 ribose 1,5-bisphosphokinase [Moritella sp. 24]
MNKLFYIIGPSGSGKDTFIQALRQQWPNNLLVAHRYITRCADSGGENHIELSLAEFMLRQQSQLFSMYWQANQHSYGLGYEIETWLDKGFDVVVNGSRAYLPTAQKKFGTQLVPVSIQVEMNILAQRLRSRGRENEHEIKHRLQRARNYHSNLPDNAICIDNSDTITSALIQFKHHYQPQSTASNS